MDASLYELKISTAVSICIRSFSPTATPTIDQDDWTTAERHAAARNAYLASVAEDAPLTGSELGRQFGRTDRWGRMQISKARAEGAGSNGHTPSRLPAIRDTNGSDRDSIPAIRDRTSTDTRTEEVSARRDGTTHFRKPTDAAGTGGERNVSADTSRSWLDSTITLVVALVAAAASYGHMLNVALMAGEPLWLARAFPITVDGLVLAAIRRGEEGRGWLTLGAAVSVAANVLAQFPEQAAMAGPIVSAWPPLALYGTHRLLHGSRHSHETRP